LTKGLVEAGYRNPLEEKVAQQLEAAGVKFTYEGLTLPVDIPARTAKSKLDFPCDGSPIIIETKGHFGGPKGKSDASAAARFKLLLLKAQYPKLDIRFVFQNAKTKIYSGSKTTNGDWATDHGFLWSDKGVVPKEWLREIREQQKNYSGPKSTKMARSRRTAKTSARAGYGRRRRTTGAVGCLGSRAAAARSRRPGYRTK
jgi:hypothetical protein